MSASNQNKAAAKATGDNEAAKTASDKAAAENNTGIVKVPALSVVASREGFRRAGYVFGKENITIALSELSKDQVRKLNDDPLLTVTEVEVDEEISAE